VERKDTSQENANKRDNKDQKEITTEVSLLSYLGNNRGGERPAPKCYNCQGTGHIARDCPSERVERQERPERTYVPRSNNAPKCYNCQQSGHIARDCQKEQAPRENQGQR